MRKRTVQKMAEDPALRHMRPALLAGIILSACSPGLPERGPTVPKMITIDAAPVSSGMKGWGSAMDPQTDVGTDSGGRAIGQDCEPVGLDEAVRREVSSRSHELRMMANMGILGPLATGDKNRALGISDEVEALLGKKDICRSDAERMSTLIEEADLLILRIRLGRAGP